MKNSPLKSQIIKHLYFDKGLSCAELSEILDKSLPSTAKAISELIDDGMVIEDGYARSSGGRRPQVYSIKGDAMYILAIAMDQFSTRIQLTDLLNNPVGDMMVVEMQMGDNSQALPLLISYINDYVKTTGIPKDKYAGIGIGMPGFINVNEGINYTHLDAGADSLTHYITQETGIPTCIDNDSSLIALAEQRFGIAKNRKDVMVINLGWGIGLGMIVNDELYRGHNGFAGEFSHIPISDSNALCNCGKRGCLETEASLLVVVQKAIQGIKEGRISRLNYTEENHPKLVGDAIMDAANNGDQFAIELLSDAGYKIGKALSILIHIMNPSNIVLSGRGAIVGKILLAPIQQALNKYCIPRLAGSTELLISELGFDAELIGAAILVMENLVCDQQ
ncbi:ROK family transcriptional regulator [Mucilaginibacter sp.]